MTACIQFCSLKPVKYVFLKEASQIYLKTSKSKSNSKFQLNRTEGAGNNPWNPKSALEPAGDALLKEAPQIYLKKSKSKILIWASKKPYNFEMASDSWNLSLALSYPDILL